jgi:hypothetical protein
MSTLSQDILAVACAGNTLTGTVSSGIFSHGLGVKGCGVISSMLLADIIKYHTNSPATSGVSYCYTMLQISAWQNLPTLIIPYHPLEWQDVKKCSRTYSAYSAFTCLFLNIIYIEKLRLWPGKILEKWHDEMMSLSKLCRSLVSRLEVTLLGWRSVAQPPQHSWYPWYPHDLP